MTPPLPGDAGFEPNEGPGPAMVGFDFDGTLAAHRGGWSLLYRLFGVEAAGDARTDAFWDGELTYDEWTAGNVADWRDRGVRREHVERAADAVTFRAGAPDLLADLRARGVPFGVISAGVRDLIRPVERFDPAFVVANEVVYEDGVPVDVVGRVPPDSKGPILERLCDDAGVDPADVVYVGDSPREDGAFEVAGTGVLLDAEGRVDPDEVEADHVHEEWDLSGLRSVVLPDDTPNDE
ncbi:MAG: HAD family hydrolase [Haloplanus sp.]